VKTNGICFFFIKYFEMNQWFFIKIKIVSDGLFCWCN